MNLHKPVLLQKTIDGLEFQEGDIYLDATVGSGGHLEAIGQKFGKKITAAGIDADSMSIEIAKERLNVSLSKLTVPKLAVMNFRNIDRAPEILNIPQPTKILFDLGWSSNQFLGNDSDVVAGLGRGFSFQKDEPLLMTFKSEIDKEEMTADDVVNRWDEENLKTIISIYGEEKFAGRIAKAIVKARNLTRITTSRQLAEIIKRAVPVWYRFGRINPATRTFQAIRIAVNDELRALEEGLQKGFAILQNNGRMAVISFHSLEDRIVKNFFKLKEENNEGQIINKKPIIPDEKEISENPRSRSAKLRILQKTKND